MTKICIDAGHGGRDSGASGENGRKEKDDALNYALKLDSVLQNLGYSVVMTRDDDFYPTLPERVEIANKEDCDIFLSLHRNAFDGTKRGIETLISFYAYDVSKVLAKNIQSRLISVEGENRGVKAQQAYVLDKTKMPAVTIELLFIDNPEDNIYFDTYLDEYVLAIADGILNTVPPLQLWELARTLKLKNPPLKGNDVADVQRALIDKGYTSLRANGIYDFATYTAVRAFQKSVGLTVDGEVGYNTATLLGGKWINDPI